ncbi:MAG: alpha/beta hydrolase [Chitinophagaceae bacterium]|jgi:pimeloyl-ACP methyl ester carboxylesterase|nr:alpha/beta hydrolase [Chitinophagaceae bacterium]
MADQHIYCISGLGADFRIFSKLKIPGAELHGIEWKMPENHDTLPAFAATLCRQIKHENALLLGVSFGGMLSVEIQKILQLRKVIIVSSCKTRNELPAYMRTAGKIGLHKVIPYWSVTQNKQLNRFIFDTRSREEELYLKRMMLAETRIEFIKRSVNMILHWQNKSCPGNVVHIHGKADKLLLPRNVKADYWIEDGGHFMIWNLADRISEIITKEIQ